MDLIEDFPGKSLISIKKSKTCRKVEPWRTAAFNSAQS